MIQMDSVGWPREGITELDGIGESHERRQRKIASDRCLEFVDEHGDAENNTIVKADQEPSIGYLNNDLADSRGEEKTREEESFEEIC